MVWNRNGEHYMEIFMGVDYANDGILRGTDLLVYRWHSSG